MLTRKKIGRITSYNVCYTKLLRIVLAYVAPQTASRGPIRYANTPSYGYTLRKPGFPQVDSYLAHGGKVQLVRNTDFYRPYITWAEAGYLISNTKA